MKKQLLDITGMSCSACSSRIEKVINKMQGVEQMNVNLLKNNAHVTFDESVVDEKAIIARIEKLGFGASVHAAGAAAAPVPQQDTAAQEMAEMQAFNLYQYVDYAPAMAYKWMASDREVNQICAYNILSRLFMKGQEPNERGIHEFLDQALTAMQSGSVGVSHAAMNAVRRFAELGVMYERVAKSAVSKHGMDWL